jgi:glycosyltransferase involved in cell wall biosynthesis
MRIAFISTSAIPSRTANSVRVMKMCQAFSALGHEARLFVAGNEPAIAWSDLAKHYGLSHRFDIEWLGRIGLLRGYGFAMRALSQAKKWEAELYFIWPFQAAALASQRGLPTILEIHDRPPGLTGPLLFRLFVGGEGGRRLIAISKSLLEWIESHYQLKPWPGFAQVAHLGVDLERYGSVPSHAQARAALRLPQGFVASYTGHLYPGRGMNLMLELARRNPQITFLWVGGEEKTVADWKERIASEGYANIRLLGFVANSDLPLVHAASDVLLMPYQEAIQTSSGSDTVQFASPMKMFEYMASERPIISSDLPVLREVLSERTAMLVPPSDVQAWHDALYWLREDPKRGAALAGRAREEVNQYTWQSRALKILAGLGV